MSILSDEIAAYTGINFCDQCERPARMPVDCEDCGEIVCLVCSVKTASGYVFCTGCQKNHLEERQDYSEPGVYRNGLLVFPITTEAL